MKGEAMSPHWWMYVEALAKFVGVTIMALTAAGAIRITARLLGPNGVGDIEEARLRQDARRSGEHRRRSWVSTLS